MKGETVSIGEECAIIIISIHSPMKGETGNKYKPSQAMRISIHSPMKGETRGTTITAFCYVNFNPLTHEG